MDFRDFLQRLGNRELRGAGKVKVTGEMAISRGSTLRTHCHLFDLRLSLLRSKPQLYDQCVDREPNPERDTKELPR